MAREAGPSSGWARSAAVFSEAAREYQLVRGADPRAKSFERTVRTNGELVPIRGALLLDAIRHAGIEPSGARLLETGSGFGALAAYFAHRGVGSVVGSELRPDFVKLARASAELADLGEGVDFVEADVRDLAPFPDQSFDAVVAAGVMVYLDPAHDLMAALESFLRVLRPGGCVAVYQANGLWLPGALRRVLASGEAGLTFAWGGPGATRRALGNVGFEQARANGVLRDRQLPSPLAAWGSYFVVTAKAPGAGPCRS